MTQSIQVTYSKVYPFPGNYKWQEFWTEGVYIFLTNKQLRKIGDTTSTYFTPFYVGQSQQIGPELLNHYRNTRNPRLRTIFAQRQGDIYVVYLPLRGEKARKDVEAELINVYLTRGFDLCNEEIPPRPKELDINIF